MGQKRKKTACAVLSEVVYRKWCPGPGSNRHGCLVRGILSPLCLPISPPGLDCSVMEARSGLAPESTDLQSVSEVVPRAGVEPARMFSPRDFKSLVSTNFTTWALEVCSGLAPESTDLQSAA